MNRKELVRILGEYFGVKPKYMKTPSFAYQIQTETDTFIIDRESKIINIEGIEFELERLLYGPQAEIERGENFNEELVISMDGHTGVTLRNLVNIISSKQRLIKKELEFETDIVTDEFVEGINNVRLLTLEDFKASAEEIGLEKVPGIFLDY